MHRFIVACVAGAATLFANSGAQAQTWSNSYWSAPTVVNWTGFYIGGQGGYQWSSVDLREWDIGEDGFSLPGLGSGANLITDGWVGGIHGGVQQQIGRWVGGVDLSGDWGGNGSSIRKSWVATVGDAQLTGTDFASANIDQIFTATGRLGYTWNNLLVYAKGGYASAEVSASIRQTRNLIIGDTVVERLDRASTEKNHQGWTLGGGFAWMIAQNVSFGVDYSYINLGSELHRGTLKGEVVPDICDIECTVSNKYAVVVDPNAIHMVSARLSFHFNNAPAPVPYK